MTFDALIVGAGPAGSTAARLLAEAGWSVAVVEKDAFPRRKVCGEFISATSLPLLDAAGVGEVFARQAGPPVRRVALFAGPAMISAPMPRVKAGGTAWGRALGREHLDVLLRDAAVAAGARLFQPSKLANLERSAAGHVATLEEPDGAQTLTARIVIAANGSWQRSGALTLTAQAHRPTDLLAFKAHFEDGDLAEDLMPLLMFPGGYGGMARTDGCRTSLSLCIRRDALARTRDEHPSVSAGEAVLAHVRGHCTGVDEALRRARLAGPFLSAGPIRPGVRPAHEGGVFRVGNAAGEAHPVIAEGISMAIQSSWLLCRRLIAAQDVIASGGDTRQIGAAYGRDWSARLAPRLHAAAALAQAAMRPATAQLIASAVGQAPGLLTWGARIAGKDALLGP